MSLSNYSSCPSVNSLPDFVQLPSIPAKIPAALLPARNASYAAMVLCCAPNPVHLTKLDKQVEDCYAWCQVPANLSVRSDFSFCLRRNGGLNRSAEEAGIWGYSAGPSTFATRTGRVVSLAVAVTLLTHMLGGIL